jgi:hypothetical protein
MYAEQVGWEAFGITFTNPKAFNEMVFTLKQRIDLKIVI